MASISTGRPAEDGSRIITTSRRRILRLSQRWPWADLVVGGHQRLTAIT